MKLAPRTAAFGAALLAAALAGCAHGPSTPGSSYPAPVYSPGGRYGETFVQYGHVRSIEAVPGRSEARGAGALLGGLVGAVVGRQFGDSGGGKANGTLIGAMGGALLGHQIERQQRGDAGALRVSVLLDQGGVRSFELPDSADLRVGDRVRIEGQRLVRL